jgi:hypothetical protein
MAAATSPFITFFIERLIGDGFCRHRVPGDNVIPSIAHIHTKYDLKVSPKLREEILYTWASRADEFHSPEECGHYTQLEKWVNFLMKKRPSCHDDAYESILEYVEDELRRQLTEEEENELASFAHDAFDKYYDNLTWQFTE